jgi:hypothetical protein
MNRERAKELAPIIAAFGAGQIIEELNPFYGWRETEDPNFEAAIHDWRIKPAPGLRPMTRGEVLYMVTTTPAMVMRSDGTAPHPASYFTFSGPINDYEYAIIDKHGEPVDGWHKFEIEREWWGFPNIELEELRGRASEEHLEAISRYRAAILRDEED